MELENIVANTVFLKARESEITKSGGRSKKWREMLALPHIKDVSNLRSQIPQNFEYIFVEQPIGELLFKQFCENFTTTNEISKCDNVPISPTDNLLPPTDDTIPKLSSCATYGNIMAFLDSKKEYDLAGPEAKLDIGLRIIKTFLNPQQACETRIMDILNDESNKNGLDLEELKNLNEETRNIEMMDKAFKTAYSLVYAYLSEKPFQEFLKTKYFDRYLQFKYLEKKPVDKVDFRMFRVLGKGGFGEVNACQHRSTGKMYACKTMHKKRIKKRGAQRLTLDEKRILTKIHSRFVVNLAYSFQTKDSLCLILTIMNGGDLKFHIQTLIQIHVAQAATEDRKTGTLWSSFDNKNELLDPSNPQGKPRSSASSLFHHRKGSSFMSSLSSFFEKRDSLKPDMAGRGATADTADATSAAIPTQTSPCEENKIDKIVSPSRLKSLATEGANADIESITSKTKIRNSVATARSSNPKKNLKSPDKNHKHYSDPGPGAFDLERARFYAAEICCGLIHMHKIGILYRDIKPENILLDDLGHVRISDLGLAVQLKPNQQIRGRVGTVGYMAPELLLDDYYSFDIDWWSMGCMLYEMIDGRTPFRGYKERGQKNDINKRSLRDHDIRFSDKFDEESKDIITKFLNKNPKKRLGNENEIETIFGHPFFSRHYNMVRMEAGKYTPDFVPDPRAVYAKDVLDIDQFSSIRGVSINEEDENFHEKFDTGAVSIPWQLEMIETKCFADLNVFSKRSLNTAEVTTHDYNDAANDTNTSGYHSAFSKKKYKFSFLRNRTDATQQPSIKKSLDDTEEKPNPTEFFKGIFNSIKRKNTNGETKLETAVKTDDSPDGAVKTTSEGCNSKKNSGKVEHLWSKICRINICGGD